MVVAVVLIVAVMLVVAVVKVVVWVIVIVLTSSNSNKFRCGKRSSINSSNTSSSSTGSKCSILQAEIGLTSEISMCRHSSIILLLI